MMPRLFIGLILALPLFVPAAESRTDRDIAFSLEELCGMTQGDYLLGDHQEISEACTSWLDKKGLSRATYVKLYLIRGDLLMAAEKIGKAQADFAAAYKLSPDAVETQIRQLRIL